MRFPTNGIPRDEVLEQIRKLQADDVDWRDGRAWSYVYLADPQLHGLLEDAYLAAMPLNGLGLKAFPSLKKMEQELVTMAGDLLGHPDAVGSVTSGGTESIFLAVKSARERARTVRRIRDRANIVVGRNAHPAFNKAGHYLGVEVRRTPLSSELTADPAAMAAAIDQNTILLVGSAPSYPHGVLDPIGELASIALEHKLPLHVDACVGGFLLPFVRRLGRPVPDFDFTVRAVTSISADLHKYGYAAKGASLILYRDADQFEYQWFTFDDWPGALYSVPNFAGTRPGGAIAAAWAAVWYLGESGYMALVRRSMDAMDRIVAGVRELGYQVVGEPVGSLFAFTSDEIDLGRVAGGMTQRGWMLSLQADPASLHLTVSAAHDKVVDDFLSDLESVGREVVSGRSGPSLAAGYN